MDDLPFNLLDRPQAGTIIDQLTRHGISWVNYRAASSDQSQFRRYMRFRHRRARHHLASLGRPLRKTSDVFERDLQFTAASTRSGWPGTWRTSAASSSSSPMPTPGTLPSFCIVDPDFGIFSEENPQDVRKGESFAAEVINRVMHGPAWTDTLLIWTYDEHGGYYDHVAAARGGAAGRRPRPQPGRAPVRGCAAC